MHRLIPERTLWNVMETYYLIQKEEQIPQIPAETHRCTHLLDKEKGSAANLEGEQITWEICSQGHHTDV